MTTSSVRDESGVLTTDLNSLLACWRNHFDRVLNISSQFDSSVIDALDVLETRHDLDAEPTFEETLAAMRNMRAGTAGGQSGILPEMILHGGNRLHHQIHELIQKVWRSGLVVLTGVTPSLFLFQRRGTCAPVTTGVA